jgi:hypothetical protein
LLWPRVQQLFSPCQEPVTKTPFHQVELAIVIGRDECGAFELKKLLKILAMELHGVHPDTDFGRLAECDQVTITIAKNVSRDHLAIT